ncbi:hypothetical protein [Methylobacterium sp. R2-1]|uniref:hypothetical protein n=1 Tax=Methylobacterium sp. R2-1 TaxID=2587064 RepID=UPI0016079DDF|nr:hypothetical protein [Methylobacterium sp. R2-1]MBB2964902.1 hypothetical protein [Methylobacterium sp. R2-1]
MGTFAMLAFFTAFGCVCGFYVSVVGFAVTSLGIALLLGLTNPLFSGPFTFGFLVLAVVAQQTGYGLAVVGRGAAHSLRRRPARTEATGREIDPEHETAGRHGQAPQGPLPR